MYFSLFFLSAPSLNAQEDDVEALGSVITLSKMAGMCGMVRQLAFFQESTKMTGGDEFISRFLTTEAARLGYSLEDFLAKCVEISEEYGRIEQAFSL